MNTQTSNPFYFEGDDEARMQTVKIHTLYFNTIQQAKYAESALYHNEIHCLAHAVRYLNNEPVLQFRTGKGLSKIACRMLEYEVMPEISSFNDGPDGEKVEGLVYTHALSFEDFEKAEEVQALIKERFAESCEVSLDDNHHFSVVEFTTQKRIPVARHRALKRAYQADLAAFNSILTKGNWN